MLRGSRKKPMANFTISTDLVPVIAGVANDYQRRLKRNVELELLAELKTASKNNFKNRTGRLRKTQRRIPGIGARIGSRNAPYWQYLDNFTRGTGRFVRGLLDRPETRERIAQRAIQRTNVDFGIVNR